MLKLIITLALLAAQALAAIILTDAPTNVQAGQTYPFTWTSTGSGGPSNALTTVDTIATISSGNTYSWTAPSKYANGVYSFEIVQGTDNNYWGPVTYSGGTGSPASSALSLSAISSASPAASSTVVGGVGSTISVSSVSSTIGVSSVSSTISVSSLNSTSSVSSMSSMSSMISTTTGITGNLTEMYNNLNSTRPTAAGNATFSATATHSIIWSNSAVATGSPIAIILCILAAMFYWQ